MILAPVKIEDVMNIGKLQILDHSLREMRCLKARETLTGQEVRDESGADIEIRNTHT
jgi:hypothetical protein